MLNKFGETSNELRGVSLDETGIHSPTSTWRRDSQQSHNLTVPAATGCVDNMPMPTKVCLTCLVIGCLCQVGTPFAMIRPVASAGSQRQNLSMRLFLSSEQPQPPSNRKSRLAGNQREPSAQELAIMDEMIYKLAEAKPYELPASVQRAFRVISSPRFFVRIAELADNCRTDLEKEKLGALASNLVATLDAVVSTAQDKLQEYAKDVESVVKAAAEPDTGEFLVPLLPERVEAMRAAIDRLDTSSSMQGDTFLSTVDAWINKSHQDGMDGMVGILQKALQLYAGRRIRLARGATTTLPQQSSADASTSNDISSSAAIMWLDELLQCDPDLWEVTIRQRQQGDGPAATTSDLVAEIQRTMELTVLSMESGSLTQRVLAEYLQEMVKRVENVQKTL
jgi:hypothetical protein